MTRSHIVYGSTRTDKERRTLGTKIVTIQVGPKRKAFSLHKKLLCSRSEYFTKAFNGGFKESEGVMYLPEDNPAVFDALVVFLYQSRLPSFPSEKFPGTVDGSNDYSDFLGEVIFFAEKLCMYKLANKSMNLIQDLHVKHNQMLYPDASGFASCYKNTGESSKIRLYYLTMAAYAMGCCTPAVMQDWKKVAIEFPEYACDLLDFTFQHGSRVFAKGKFHPGMREGEASLGRCFFHTHSPGEICHL